MRAKYLTPEDLSVEYLGEDSYVNGYSITKQRKFTSNTSSVVFGVEFNFETNFVGYLIRYYLICCILVALVSSISFMIKPSIVPGRAGLLVTLFLVLANFFSLAQVICYLFIYNQFMLKLISI